MRNKKRKQKELNGPNDIRYIRLLGMPSFEALTKIPNELEKTIGIPIHDFGSDGNTQIASTQPSSIWLIISLSCIALVKLIGAISWTVAVIRKKRAEAKILENHAKTLNLKNNALLMLIEAQKKQISNMLTAEAQTIQSSHYSHNDPEVLARLKLSLNIMADLIDRGTKITTPSSDEKLTQKFPDFTKTKL
ncbi:hypothetical protein AAHN97_22830 [Chitinophaga niabensis]|uniref:hypothetical protein n=1 Tax=Chitinophaga niabensis TaxID=536979 RepID=UPI0031BB5556